MKTEEMFAMIIQLKANPSSPQDIRNNIIIQAALLQIIETEKRKEVSDDEPKR